MRASEYEQCRAAADPVLANDACRVNASCDEIAGNAPQTTCAGELQAAAAAIIACEDALNG